MTLLGAETMAGDRPVLCSSGDTLKQTGTVSDASKAFQLGSGRQYEQREAFQAQLRALLQTRRSQQGRIHSTDNHFGRVSKHAR